MTSLEDRLRLENREFREQLGSAMETAGKLGEKLSEIRDRLAYHINGRGHVEDDLLEVFYDISRLAGRTRSCPLDTNGDGDCGRPMCPYCGPRARKQTLSTRQTLDAPL